MKKLELYYPTKPFKITQKFGENPKLYAQFNIKGHNGLDILAAHGLPIYATHDGIGYYQVDGSQGHGVVVRTNETLDFQGKEVFYKTIYWHFCDYRKEPKFKPPVPTSGAPFPVKRGDLLGYADNTGFSMGDHLHFGLKPILPGKPTSDWGDVTDFGIGDFKNVAQTNGYLGSIDPTFYFNGKFATDPDILEPEDAVAVLAATEQAKGNVKEASILWSIVQFIKSFLHK